MEEANMGFENFGSEKAGKVLVHSEACLFITFCS